MERHADARHTEGARDIPAVVSGDDGIAIKNGKKRSVQRGALFVQQNGGKK